MFEPLFDRVLVVDDKQKELTEGGLVIPGNAAPSRLCTASVISVGTGFIRNGKTVPLVVRPGDRVMFRLPAGTEIEIDGVVHRLLRESEIFGILD